MGSFSIYLVRGDGSKSRAVRIGSADTLMEAEAFVDRFARAAAEYLLFVDRDRVEIRWKHTMETVSVKKIDACLTEK